MSSPTVSSVEPLAVVVKSFFDPITFTFSYVVHDPASKHCAIIDSVLDFSYASGNTSYAGVDEILQYIAENKLSAQWILETHVHADHLCAALYLKQRTGARIGIGAKVVEVQKVFAKAFNFEENFDYHGGQFDCLFEDGDDIQLGNITGKAMLTAGHTPACMTYVFDDAAFVGDTLFMPDFGTARCDFPGGDAEVLYESIQKIFTLASTTRLFTCHDYKAPGRDEYANETTVGEQMSNNIHVGGGKSKSEFVTMRQQRDSQLSMPQLILPSVQVNIRAGQMPPAEDNGQVYLKVPINYF